MNLAERTELLQHPVARALLSFELTAHDRVFRCATAAERRVAYREIYSQWPRFIADFNRLRGGGSDALGFAQVFVEWFRPWLVGARVLEVGCGSGIAARALAAAASRIVGIDVSQELVHRASKEKPSNVTFICADAADRLPFPGGQFDTVYWNDVAEHLHPDDLLHALKEIHRVLRPGGALCTVTCHRDDGPHDASMLVLPVGSAPLGVHLQEFTYAEWDAILRRARFGAPRAPVVGINLLRKLGLLPRIRDLMRTVGLPRTFERTSIRRAATLRWAFGTDVICSVATKEV